MQVKSTRKGLTNQLKTLLWRKPLTGSAVSIQGRDSPLSGSVHGGSVHGGAANGGLTAYSGAPIESQMRSLADLAFLMQVQMTLRPSLFLCLSMCRSAPLVLEHCCCFIMGLDQTCVCIGSKSVGCLGPVTMHATVMLTGVALTDEQGGRGW